MNRLLLLIIVLAHCVMTRAQGTQVNEQLAKAAVYRIVRYSGLQPDFIVRGNPDIPTAIAFIKGRKRYIEYNPSMMAGILDSTLTDWGAVSILAHEIGHHLLGHTLDPAQLHPGDELACDAYSGFVLHNMGATLEESLAAIRITGHPTGTLRHPAKDARADAICQGWQESERIQQGEIILALPVAEKFALSVVFEGDPNTYYVNAQDELVWFNAMARPIVLGTYEDVDKPGFRRCIRSDNDVLYVDGSGVIWSTTNHGAQTPIGKITKLE